MMRVYERGTCDATVRADELLARRGAQERYVVVAAELGLTRLEETAKAVIPVAGALADYLCLDAQRTQKRNEEGWLQ